jgi:protein phosphatase
MIVPVVG